MMRYLQNPLRRKTWREVKLGVTNGAFCMPIPNLSWKTLQASLSQKETPALWCTVCVFAFTPNSHAKRSLELPGTTELGFSPASPYPCFLKLQRWKVFGHWTELGGNLDRGHTEVYENLLNSSELWPSSLIYKRKKLALTSWSCHEGSVAYVMLPFTGLSNPPPVN